MINLTFFLSLVLWEEAGVPGENPHRLGDNMQTLHKYQTVKICNYKDAAANSLFSDVDSLNAHQNLLLKHCIAAPAC